MNIGSMFNSFSQNGQITVQNIQLALNLLNLQISSQELPQNPISYGQFTDLIKKLKPQENSQLANDIFKILHIDGTIKKDRLHEFISKNYKTDPTIILADFKEIITQEEFVKFFQ
ncbi:hypothetical protein SS50377_23576 [Spironucleus salmonicida]|uniref:Uncharacterized protein n=1 Tax=Spironucleus salmonicida TaxID=348837 RepID=V6M5C3_9EUKA|nr:hypothetical protein SS50377_23576 [Spironucleus salmonicida]|eukprot:EST48559.1 Hypothetical protein SS50377_11170 [Spironucleus salmonicida]